MSGQRGSGAAGCLVLVVALVLIVAYNARHPGHTIHMPRPGTSPAATPQTDHHALRENTDPQVRDYTSRLVAEYLAAQEGQS